MSKFKGHYRHTKRNSKPSVGKQAKEVLETLDENNPVIKMFRVFSSELDDRHDRHERIVKLSRDITIESKRIIFLLHSSNTDIEEKKKSVLLEADLRLQNLYESFKFIAMELIGHSGYLYHRAFTSGMQEFVEALCFYHFIKEERLHPWAEINQKFFFEDAEKSIFNLLFTQYDFILGIADFTGELMRKCINTLGSGNVNDCFRICNFMRAIHTGFLSLSHSGNREISRKAYVLKQSLAKMELVCYNIQIRGSEIPKHMLLSVIDSHDVEKEDDEGFCM
ncbi:translin-associated protein X isoform X1 [Euwallacea fornicatus]|uniref:translin-associated protein X isoform X1 n=2 Tax=Euwallacea fornicatus TaxID=995702 RepID=UPI00338F6B48